jgi:hypothetical protein
VATAGQGHSQGIAPQRRGLGWRSTGTGRQGIIDGAPRLAMPSTGARVLIYSGRSARVRAALLTVAYLLACGVMAGLHSIGLRVADAADVADDAQSEATEARRIAEDTQQDVDTLYDDVDGLRADVTDLQQAVAAVSSRVQR